jgi:hypothetical protein
MAGQRSPGRNDSAEDRLVFYGWVVSATGCWEWNGPRDARGYGSLMIARRQKRAHRVAYEVWIGPLAESDVVMHSCDNPPCINPQHLQAGTQAANMSDKMSKNRHRPGGQKLIAEDVRHIRAGAESELVTASMLADLYGISREAITKIVTRRTWKEIV